MTLLIKNGLVYDGSGEAPLKQDVLVRGGRIAKLGSFSKNQAEKLIDATGAVVAPGFIDVNSSADHYLNIFEENGEEKYIREGVTSVIGGNCGASLAPVLDGSLISFRKWTDTSKLNINWHDHREFREHLTRIGLGINFGTLVGHSTIRRALLGETTRDLTERELISFKHILKRALKDGAFGLSTGLEFAHAKSTPKDEIKELVGVVALEKRIYATHLRDYHANLNTSVEETIDIAKKTGVNLEISHLEPSRNESSTYSKVLKQLEKEVASLRINFDVNPLPFVAVPIYQFLPDWLKRGNLEEMVEYLNAGHLQKKILEYLRKFSNKDIYIHNMPPSLNFLIGKSLKDYALSNEIKINEALLKLMRLSKLRAVLTQRTLDEKLLEDFILSSSSFISSGESNIGGAFLKFMEFAVKYKKISMEKAIQKLTALPADKYKIKNRGEIQEGYFADIVILKDLNPITVLVNGRIVLEDGEFKGGLKAGRFLKYAE